jgi:hypothetical protein
MLRSQKWTLNYKGCHFQKEGLIAAFLGLSTCVGQWGSASNDGDINQRQWKLQPSSMRKADNHHAPRTKGTARCYVYFNKSVDGDTPSLFFQWFVGVQSPFPGDTCHFDVLFHQGHHWHCSQLLRLFIIFIPTIPIYVRWCCWKYPELSHLTQSHMHVSSQINIIILWEDERSLIYRLNPAMLIWKPGYRLVLIHSHIPKASLLDRFTGRLHRNPPYFING